MKRTNQKLGRSNRKELDELDLEEELGFDPLDLEIDLGLNLLDLDEPLEFDETTLPQDRSSPSIFRERTAESGAEANTSSATHPPGSLVTTNASGNGKNASESIWS